MQKLWHIIAAGSDLGVHVDGARRGPAKILSTLAHQQKNLTLNVTHIYQPENFHKAHMTSDRAKNLAGVTDVNQQVYRAAIACEHAGQKPLTIGGDHSLSIASALSARKFCGPIGIIWLDAHTDFHTRHTTITGNLHGLPLAVITGCEREILRAGISGPTIDPHQCVIVGARSIDPPEWQNLAAAGVSVITNEQVQQMGVARAWARATQIASGGGRTPYHVSFDLDVIDPRLAPGVSVPASGGLHLAQVEELIQLIAREQKQITSFDLMEFNPARDKNDQTLVLADRILTPLLTATGNDRNLT